MVNDVKEENNSPRPPARDGAGNDNNNNNNNRRGGRRGARNRWNNATAGGTPTQNNAAKYKSRNKDIPDDVVFDNAGQNDAANFQHAVQGMANYLHTTYSAEVGDAIRLMKEVIITLPSPPAPTTDAAGNTVPISFGDEFKWKQDYTDANARLRMYTTSMPKAFIHIYIQCVALSQPFQESSRTSQIDPRTVLLFRFKNAKRDGDDRLPKTLVYVLSA